MKIIRSIFRKFLFIILFLGSISLIFVSCWLQRNNSQRPVVLTRSKFMSRTNCEPTVPNKRKWTFFTSRFDFMAARNDRYHSLELPTTWGLLPRLHPPPAKWDKVEPVKTQTDRQTSRTRLKADITGTGCQPPTPPSSACGLLVRSV